MDATQRYEPIATIATGDFAAVFRARDRELGREVAIKEIHRQFLTDPQQLARYWQEAQLLASLQHPNILTIYDIVRPRGWLILELMQGNLQQTTGGNPIDLGRLRLALIDCLGALQFLHGNGIIHGDVKPSNMLVDSRNRVVLGDFGLARRASNEQGSLLKGTTKYMAPELISDQFGAVGPASDLYSLGFAAYELMCGKQFEELFPGLSTFGRDKQIAWMMWHAAADRKLPEIGRVLEGVPDDLAHVIQRLVTKNQSQRYHTAQEVLGDLQAPPGPALPPDAEDAEAAAEAARRKRRMRVMAIAAMACSLILCIVMLLPTREKPKPAGPPPPARGIVSNVFLDERKLEYRNAEDGSLKEISLSRDDRVLINNQQQSPRHLLPGDRITINLIRDRAGRPITEVVATRAETDQGAVKAVQTDQGTLLLTLADPGDGPPEKLISVADDVPIVFNGKDKLDGRAVQLADLQPGDRVTVEHLADERGRKALSLSVLRVVTSEGFIRELDVSRRQITVAIDDNGEQRLVTLALAPKCTITLNAMAVVDDRLVKLQDLRPGDMVSIESDTAVVRVDAYRVLREKGTVRAVQYTTGALSVVPDEGTTPVTYLIGPECKITLSGQSVGLEDLRNGDTVDIAHDSPGSKSPEAIAVSARRPIDPRRWAILIANQAYEDPLLSRLTSPVPDATLLRDVLVGRYAVPPNQVELMTDESRVRLERGIPSRLASIPAEGRLLVYVALHAYQGDDGVVYMAPKDFDGQRMEVTGLPLQWLVDQLETCPAGEKLLLLDLCHGGTGADLARQPSTAEMIETLKRPPGRGPFRTITAVASCSAGQRGLPAPEEGHGLFAWCLADGYRGNADKNRDLRLEPTELFSFLEQAMPAAAGQGGATQTPVLRLPDERPPRLTDEARKAIRLLAAQMKTARINLDEATTQYANAAELAGKELEPRLLYGLILLKAKKQTEAVDFFAEILADRPDQLLSLYGSAWAKFERRSYGPAVADLLELIPKIPMPAGSEEYPEFHQRIFYNAGQLREYVATAVDEAWRPPANSLAALDAAVAAHGELAQQRYQQGRARSQFILNDFDQKLAQATDADAAKLKVERRRMVHYATFPYDFLTDEILEGLAK